MYGTYYLTVRQKTQVIIIHHHLHHDNKGQDYSANPDICNFLNLNLNRTEEPVEPLQPVATIKIDYPTSMSGILTKKTIGLAVADEIASFAIKACKANGFNPISVCVMDPSGHEIVTKRMDGCPVS
jgi:hypothetical protein